MAAMTGSAKLDTTYATLGLRGAAALTGALTARGTLDGHALGDVTPAAFWPSSPVARRSASRAPRLRATLSLPKPASTSLFRQRLARRVWSGQSPTKATATPSNWVISAGDSEHDEVG